MPSKRNTKAGKPNAFRRFLSSTRGRLFIAGSVVAVAIAALSFFYFFLPNARPPEQPYYLHIYTGTTYPQLLAQMKEEKVLVSEHTFDVTAKLLGLDERVRPGRYRIQRNIGNLELVRKLRNGNQDPLTLSFTTVRTPQALANKLASQLELPADSFLAAFRDEAFLAKLGEGFTPQTAMAFCIPNSYEVYWTVRPKALVTKLHAAYEQFWTAERIRLAEAQSLTPLKTVILASIVQAETYRSDERPRVAGVYLNRLKINMPLQADPTVIFAVGDFSIRRVLKAHLETDSPYNTYKYTGLPPGPINCPSLSAIEAVLRPESHNYYFFAARPDGSGYHNFNTLDNYRNHVNQANKYRRQLTRQQQQAKAKRS